MAKRIFYIDEISSDIRENNAGSKAREDVATILNDTGCEPIGIAYDPSERKTHNPFVRLGAHVATANDWKNALSTAGRGDTVIIQFPLGHHSIFAKQAFAYARSQGVDIVLVIHDLDFIRLSATNDNTLASKLRVRAEELSLLQLASKLIAHNECMKKELVAKCAIDPEKITTLEVFDYLIPDESLYAKASGPAGPIIIAGNLRREKAGYIYHLPANVDFNLYGAGYDDDDRTNVHYRGQFTPEELISKLEGSFGLVWDGDSTLTCQGPFGSYLRLNNPHKTSLYLASGLPVVVWDQAALASFVIDQGIGITISCLSDIATAINALSDNAYEEMKDNAKRLSQQLRAGHFTKRAIKQAMTL